MLRLILAPPELRREALFLAALFAILATAIALWRSRFNVLAVLALVVATVAGLHLWNARRGPPAGSAAPTDFEGNSVPAAAER